MNLKAITLALTVLAPCIRTLAQEVAITPSGKRVLLDPNGTWKFETTSQTDTNKNNTPSHRIKPSNASEKLDLNKGKATLFFDPSIWKIKPQQDPTRFELIHKDGDAYAVVIAERLEVSLDALKNIAIGNAKKVSSDVAILSEDRLLVNGTEMISIKYRASTEGIKFVFFGHLFGGKAGCIQVLTYTSDNLFDEYHNDFQHLIDGLVVKSS